MPFIKYLSDLNRGDCFFKQVSHSNDVNAACVAIAMLVSVEVKIRAVSEWEPVCIHAALNKLSAARISINIPKQNTAIVRMGFKYRQKLIKKRLTVLRGRINVKTGNPSLLNKKLNSYKSPFMIPTAHIDNFNFLHRDV